MEASDYLLTTAEVAVAFVGFAAIVVAIRERANPLESSARLLLGWMVERGLAALFFALLPLLLGFLGVAEGLIWRLGCAGIFLYILSALVRSIRAWLTDSGIRALIDPINYYLRATAIGIVGVVQLLAALGVGLTASVGWYLFGVSWLLVQSAMVFITIMRGRAA